MMKVVTASLSIADGQLLTAKQHEATIRKIAQRQDSFILFQKFTILTRDFLFRTDSQAHITVNELIFRQLSLLT